MPRGEERTSSIGHGRPGASHAALLDWFDTLGWEAFDYQRRTWSAYLEGGEGLVHAPTGTGKTYAVWGGPLLEWMADATPDATPNDGEAPPLHVLWITPLRALANDTLEALREPVSALGLPWRVERRTGDTPQSVRARQRSRMPTTLITTPESLSLLLSYPDSRRQFARLRCVIVDEWHELMGTKRGVQTELGLAALRTLAPTARVWGLSATLGNLDEAM
ncbi:MAG: DEAD/DEAH box helicase, partial [Planctomycetota bacterium]